jgi:hypothetical protein
MENNIQPSQVSNRIERPGIMSRLLKVFSEPSGLFGNLIGKTDWLIPLIIIGLVGGIINYQTRPLYADGMYKAIVERVESYREQLPEARYNQIVEDMEKQFAEARENSFKWYYPPLWFLLPFIFMAVVAGVGLMTGNFVFGGKANFWIIFNVVAYAALIGLLGDLVRGIMMLAKNSMFVYTGLGILRPANDGSFLFYLLRQIDLFSIWRIVVTAIGLGVIYKMNPKKFAYILFAIWAIFMALVAVANQFTGGTIIY